jgi:hypothetical protein
MTMFLSNLLLRDASVVRGLAKLSGQMLGVVMKPRNLRISLLALSLATFSCSGTTRPLQDADFVAEVPAHETGYLVREQVLVPAPFGRTYVLLPGEYHPTHIDGHGVFYASPLGIVEREGEAERTLTGGIHSPNQGGRYYSFPALFVDLGDGTFSKLPLPEEVLRLYGTAIVFTHNGKPVH